MGMLLEPSTDSSEILLDSSVTSCQRIKASSDGAYQVAEMTVPYHVGFAPSAW